VAYMFVVGSCVGCQALITFNPSLVPSLRVNGQREPLCPRCHARWNEIHRTSKGLPPLEAHPEAWEPEEVA
jgi:hypothetical protein